MNTQKAINTLKPKRNTANDLKTAYRQACKKYHPETAGKNWTMKVEIINKHGITWEFDSIEKAMPHIKKDKRNDYQVIDGVRIYDDRDEFAEIDI